MSKAQEAIPGVQLILWPIPRLRCRIPRKKSIMRLLLSTGDVARRIITTFYRGCPFGMISVYTVACSPATEQESTTYVADYATLPTHKKVSLEEAHGMNRRNNNSS